MAGPLYADDLLVLIRRALRSLGDGACKVYVDTGGVDDGFVHCTARVDGDGDIVITPAGSLRRELRNARAVLAMNEVLITRQAEHIDAVHSRAQAYIHGPDADTRDALLAILKVGALDVGHDGGGS